MAISVLPNEQLGCTLQPGFHVGSSIADHHNRVKAKGCLQGRVSKNTVCQPLRA